MTSRLSIGRAVLCFTVLAFLPATAAAQVRGTVVEAVTMTPIPEAIVTLQATTVRVRTLPDGSFDLGATGSNLVIVAAKKGYRNASVSVTSPASGVIISLEPVPQSDNPSYVFEDPQNSCVACHVDQVQQWTGSPMAKAGTNTWVYDIYDGSGTAGGMGGFVYTRDSVFAASNPESECASCHQPEPWIQQPFTGLEDLGNLSQEAMHGISCEVCHKVANIDESKPNFPGIWPGIVTITRPDVVDGQVQYGVLGDTDFDLFSTMRPSYQPQLTAALCAACHQDKNDPDEDHDFEEANGVISEPTYLEWLASPYGDPTLPTYADCVDCHMPAYGATHVAQGLGPARDPSTIRHHRIEGTTADYLENAVTLTVSCDRTEDTLELDVDVFNGQTGHHVPTGVTIRNMILLVEAWRESDGQPLVYTGTQTVHALGGVGDPASGYYAGLPGKLFAKHNHDQNGNGPTFFTDATGILWDNRIPALATDSTHYSFAAPAGTGAVHIRARLIYRRAFRAFVDAKQWTLDGHGNPLEDVAPPHFGHLMESTELIVHPGPGCPPGAALCFGDGGGAACPCGNDSPTSGESCVHSGGTGMTIAGSGTSSIAADDLSITASQCPPGNTGIFYSGTVSLDPGNQLFDGLQCAGGDVRRYRGRFQSSGVVSDTGFVGQDPSGLYFVPGVVYFFQYWSRDAAAGASPCNTFANLSPAYAVTMTP